MTRPKLPKAADLTAPKRARTQFAIVPAYVVLNPDITPAQKAVMQVICLYANQDGWAWPTLQTIGDVLGVQKPQVSKMIDALVTAGCLETQFRVHNGKRKMFFRVLHDRPVETLLEAVEEAGDAPDSVSTTETSGAGTGFRGGNDKFPSRKLGVSVMETPFFEQTKEQTKEQRTPPPAREVVGLEAEFEDPEHRAVYLTLRRAHRFAVAFDATLRTLIQPMAGGPAHTWAEVGAALVAQAGNGETFNELRVRGYMRTARESVDRARGAARSARGAPSKAVALPAGQTQSVQAVWDMFVRGGFTAPMQTRETLAERAQVLARDGQVPDADAFLALVLHVKPWALAEIKFAKAREERLLELLASHHAPAQGVA